MFSVCSLGMTTLSRQVPERWVCHECSLQQNNSGHPSENGTVQHQFGRQKAVGTGKVKFISPEEAAQQISGSWKSPPTISVSTSRRPLASSDHAALPMFSSGHLNPPAASKEPAVVDGKGELSKSSSQRARRKHEPSRSEDNKAISRSGKAYFEFLFDYLNSISIELVFTFNDANGDIEIVGEVSCNNVYGGLQAHPPTKIHRKAWELSRQMPRALQFAAIPRAAIWTKRELFKDRRPIGLDIALYIFPTDFKRSKFQYSCLLEFIEEEDFILGCCINGVELFVSTSKLLDADSWGKFNWGILPVGSLPWGGYQLKVESAAESK
ncbi:hypothetical protein RJ641_009426 [Dillenia turbinata]|uniref:AIPP2-like SPOC-like domain-containing protein n=1 Tax=Dillenia turbinata TaxID=194707 RepID=A0AAN8V0C4_9MAGN